MSATKEPPQKTAFSHWSPGKSWLATGIGRSWFAAVIISVAALAAYHNSFHVPFLLDDEPAVARNLTIRHLWPLGEVLSPPPNTGPSGRPLLNLSFAINYAIGGTKVWSYHAVNLLIHILNGLLLFGIVRRLLSRWSASRSPPKPGEGGEVRRSSAKAESPTCLPVKGAAERVGDNPLDPALLALAVALLWTVHPLQTEAVTYISERAETLMGFFYLLTLYCFIRGVEPEQVEPEQVEPEQGGRRPPGGGVVGLARSQTDRRPEVGGHLPPIWFALSVAACLLGMATKEVMVTAPLMIFLCDSIFFAGSPRSAWRSRRPYYLGLAATWLFLAGLMLMLAKHSVGFHYGVGSWEYALTECQAVVHYLELAAWPQPLVFDYGPLLVSGLGKVLPDIFLLLLLLVGTVAAFRRSPALGFLGAWFFVILAPTSSVVPVALQPIAENRIYLPLAAVIAGFVLAAHRVLGTRARWLILAIALGSIAWTARRNEDYRDAVTLWSDTVRKRPHNPRAQDDFGNALAQAGRRDEAIQHLRLALQLTPTVGRIHYNLAKVLHDSGRRDEAIREYEEAVRLDPTYADAQVNLATALAEAGRPGEAEARLNRALQLDAGDAGSHYNLGLVLFRGGQIAGSVREFQRALQIDPTAIEPRDALGTALFRLGHADEAIGEYERVLEAKPDDAAAHNNLGNVLFALGRVDEARRQFERALQLQPDYSQAQTSLGVIHLQLGDVEKAQGDFEASLRLDPSDAEAHFRLGNILAMGGRFPEAITQWEATLRLRPDDAEAHNNLATALAQAGRIPEAIRHYQEAIRLKPDYDRARANLADLQARQNSAVGGK